jgi:hypothetical protein
MEDVGGEAVAVIVGEHHELSVSHGLDVFYGRGVYV